MVAKEMPNNARWYVCDFCSDRHPQHTFINDRKINDESREWDICDHCMDQLSDFIDTERAKATERQSQWERYMAGRRKGDALIS